MKYVIPVTCLILGLSVSITQATTKTTTEAAPETANDDSSVSQENAISVDLEAGKKLYKKTCKNCHGPTAKGMASFPKLADKETAYLIERLNQYRAGEKVGPNSALMSPQAAKLSDADISNISHYISSLGK